ncbi:NAD(P)/FAD-dependent oxidoreductase [Streptomyces sp. NBC_01257]|uniref:NAD(P)/FAD-dependent oxidoreductase n=1 Tax=Streptomyces sp. NBC_01257 TaxID=2903799 RepID=UPI002DD7AE74|nr:FAD-dependent oxidoreductase [Streptomyces sp. NBC_01257]WRZ63517.1 FAD-dependent oxidoreductase [Streptomyces sp. NBC_01257]
MLNRIVVVGAAAAGLTAVETLRAKGYEGRLTLVGDERHPPYDRPPLSKELLGESWEPSDTWLRKEDVLAALDVDLRLGCRAIGLDQGARTIALSTGERLPYDAAVIATGLRPRRLPCGDGLQGVHVLRSLDDAVRLREALGAGRPEVAVIGAGFLGAEVAATARGAGLGVTLIDTNDQPLARQVGAEIGGLVAGLHRDNGVRLVLGADVVGMARDGTRVRGVMLSDGAVVDADLVVVAIGSVPAVDWLADSGLPLGDGVLCDAYCRAAPGVWAAGDVANWPHPMVAGARVRLEQRTNAAQQAMAVAANLLAGETGAKPYTPVPFGWTHQFGEKIQTVGWCPPDARTEIISGSTADRVFVAAYHRDGVLVGGLGWNSARGLRQCRQLLGRPSSELTAAAAGV